jgi:hypothetical protein
MEQHLDHCLDLKKWCPVTCFFSFGKWWESDGAKSGLCGGWSETVKPRRGISAVFHVLVCGLSLSCWRKTCCMQNKLFEYVSSVFLAFQCGISWHEFQMHCIINISESSEHDTAGRIVTTNNFHLLINVSRWKHWSSLFRSDIVSFFTLGHFYSCNLQTSRGRTMKLYTKAWEGVSEWV